jgi:hypothetical protein
MGPLIDAELERVDRRHAQLTRLSTELVDALWAPRVNWPWGSNFRVEIKN